MTHGTGLSILTLSFLALLLLADTSNAGTRLFPDSSKLPSQPGLPDPLVMFNGKPVATRAGWFRNRRPELKALFQRYMYGTMPPRPKKMSFSVERVDYDLFGGKATMKQVTIALGPGTAPRIHLLLIIPSARKRAAPLFLGLNFCGNCAVIADSRVPLPQGWMPKSCTGCADNRATEAGRGSQMDVWAIEQSIDRGYAVASVYNGDIDPDAPDNTAGVRRYYRDTTPEEHRGDYDWGTIAAWSWGLMRAVDYLVTDKDIDPRRIAVIGHSRNGKAALLTAAFDERIALAIPLQAGCGGTSPSRGKVGESVRVINDHFPHWFNAEFKRFNAEPDHLPFDQHSLIALCAPRPVLLSNATEDSWANPLGQFEMLQAADRVYRFLGAQGLEASTMPEPGRLIDSNLGYYIRPGKHSMTTGDWKVFLDFADKHLR